MKQVFNISPGNTDSAAEQELSMRLGEKHFGFAISSGSTNELLQLAWYTAEQPSAYQLEDIYHQHPELKRSFNKIRIGYDHNGSLLIPADLPAKNEPSQLLRIMYGVNGKHTVITENVNGWQLQNVYAVPVETKDWVAKHFPSSRCLHNFTVAITRINGADANGSLLVDFHTNHFMVIAGKSNQLLLAQSFSYSTPADVIYYLLKISNEFSLSQESVSLLLSGLIEKESNLYRELVHYFLKVQFREPAWQMPVQEEENYPSHFFTSLNDLAICES